MKSYGYVPRAGIEVVSSDDGSPGSTPDESQSRHTEGLPELEAINLEKQEEEEETQMKDEIEEEEANKLEKQSDEDEDVKEPAAKKTKAEA